MPEDVYTEAVEAQENDVAYISPIPEIEKEIVKYSAEQKLGEATERLMANPDFKLVFDQHFTKAYRETSASNVALFTGEQKDGYMYQIVARSIVENFLSDKVEEGQTAGIVVDELKEVLLEVQKQETGETE